MTSAQQRLQITPTAGFSNTRIVRLFFYLGNTAWQLFHRLTLVEAERDLTNCAAKGFTVPATQHSLPVQAASPSRIKHQSLPRPLVGGA